MRFRSGALAGWLIGAFAFLGLVSLLATADPTAPVGGRLGLAGAAVVFALGIWRAAVAGLDVRADCVIVRSIFWSRRVASADVAGVGIEPVVRRRFARLDVVTNSGETIPVVFAAWRMRTPVLQSNAMSAAATLGWVTGATSAADVVPGRVE